MAKEASRQLVGYLQDNPIPRPVWIGAGIAAALGLTIGTVLYFRGQAQADAAAKDFALRAAPPESLVYRGMPFTVSWNQQRGTWIADGGIFNVNGTTHDEVVANAHAQIDAIAATPKSVGPGALAKPRGLGAASVAPIGLIFGATGAAGALAGGLVGGYVGGEKHPRLGAVAGAVVGAAVAPTLFIAATEK
jgi:hypothetical protein